MSEQTLTERIISWLEEHGMVQSMRESGPFTVVRYIDEDGEADVIIQEVTDG